MDKLKRELKHSIGDTKRIANKEKEADFKRKLLGQYNEISRHCSCATFALYADSVSKKYSVPIGKIGDWAKDLYVGFNGKKPVGECIKLAFELEKRTREAAVEAVINDDEYFQAEMGHAVKQEFFCGKETMSLEEAESFFFADPISKDIQGKRVRTSKDLFRRLLHNAFAIVLVPDFNVDESEYQFDYRNLYNSLREYRFIHYKDSDTDYIEKVLKNGISPRDFYRILSAYLFEWKEYCALK